MTREVFGEEWSEACRERLNARAEFRRVAGTWEAPVVLVMRDAAERAVFLDLHRGECRAARPALPADFERAEFVLAAGRDTWRRLLHREIEPVGAVLFGKLKLEKGSLPALVPYTAAAREMVAAAGEVEAVFP